MNLIKKFIPVDRSEHEALQAQYDELLAANASLTEAIAQMESASNALSTQIEQLTADGTATEKTTQLEEQLQQANATQEQTQATLDQTNSKLAETQQQIDEAQARLAAIDTLVSGVQHPTIEAAESTQDKVQAMITLLTSKPNVIGTVTTADPDKSKSPDGVDWATLNSLPHMQESE